MVRALALIVLAAGAAPSQTVDGPALLGRIRQHVRSSITDIPNYTCLETMERTTSAPDGQIEFHERLRLEVLVAEKKELFAWPGSTDFTDPLRDWIGGGAIGTGNFWIQLYNLFVGSAAAETYVGEEVVGRESLYRFNFHVPKLSSQFSLSVQGKSATTAYSGSFWVDKDSLDLVRLETRAEDIPPDIDCLEDRTSATYSRLSLGNAERLVPSVSELKIVSRGRRQSHNTITFSGCKHYAAESSVSFGDEASAAQPATGKAPPPKETALPADLTLSLKLQQPITSEESAAGDPIVALLDKAVRSGDIRLLKGTPVLGRIRRLEQHRQDHRASTVVALEFFAIDAPDGRIRFKARLTGPVPNPAEMRATIGLPDFTSGTDGLDIVDDGRESGVGRFRVGGKNLRLDRGFHTTWETL